MNPARDADAVPTAAQTDYEALRRALLEGHGGERELGLALLMRRGMAAWIRAWSACVTPAPPVQELGCGAQMPLPAGVRGEITRLLVTMAFSAHQKEMHR